MRELVLTATGSDRPGLVEELSRHLVEHGGNLADSRMVNLRGTFALVVLVEGDDLASLVESLPRAAKGLGLRIEVTPVGARPSDAPSVPFTLRAYSMDRPGIVHKLSSVLAKHEVNIEELETRVESASFSGAPLFVLTARLRVPASLPVRQLRHEVDAVAHELNCDVDLDRA